MALSTEYLLSSDSMSQSTDTNLFRVPLSQQASDLVQAIRKAPTNASLRVHYAQLCMVMGDWGRAVGQLQTAAQITAQAIPMAQAYREAVRCERMRESVFNGEQTPFTLGEPDAWLQLLFKSLSCASQGDTQQAAALQAQAFEQAAETAFIIDGETVQWIADADSRLGPVCEVFLNGNYYWIPFENIQTLEIDPPSDLRDLVWLPARLTLHNGDKHPVLLPSRYPSSHAQDNDALALASLTEWSAMHQDFWIGMGQRMFITSNGEYPILGVRLLSSQVTRP